MNRMSEGYNAGLADGREDKLLDKRPFPYQPPTRQSDQWHRGYHLGYQHGYYGEPPRGRKHLSAAAKADIVARGQAGHSIHEISLSIGYSHETVRKILKEGCGVYAG